MSVKKYIISKNAGNFTTIPNKVLQNLSNAEALGLYCYLASLPQGWEFHKKQLRDHFGIGINKLDTLIGLLEAHHLIRTVQVRTSKGRFAHFDLAVDDGTSYEIKELTNDVQPFNENRATDNRATVNSTYKENKNKLNNYKENTKLLSASTDAQLREDVSFEDFWKIYPRKKNKVRSKKIWDKKKYSDIATLICEDVVRRKHEEAQWQNPEFIPHPSTYLHNELWTDDITPKDTPPKKSGNSSFSNVMFGTSANKSGRTYDELGNDFNPFG